MEINWIRPVLILGALVLLIVLNVLEFKGKRKRDATDKVAITASSDPAVILAHKQYLQTQNIEQVAHIIKSVLIAILLAVLSA
ncbi:MAG: hypothetical protein QNL02_10215 [Paracoccaceae bacterium]